MASADRGENPEGNGSGMVATSLPSRVWVPDDRPYRAVGRRDPFVPLNRATKKNQIGSEQPIRAAEESGIPKVLGIVLGRGGYRALLQRSDGDRIVVEPGSELKHEQARVIHIFNDAVSLEYRLDENGQTQFVERRISIHSSETMIDSRED